MKHASPGHHGCAREGLAFLRTPISEARALVKTGDDVRVRLLAQPEVCLHLAIRPNPDPVASRPLQGFAGGEVPSTFVNEALDGRDWPLRPLSLRI